VRFLWHGWLVSINGVSFRDVEAIRTRVLGWPPGPVPGDEDPSATHLVRRNETGGVIAAVSFVGHRCPERPHEAAVYLWGMAVLAEFQRRGVGTALLGELLAESRRSGATIVWADARATAVSFYLRAGAVVEGPPFADEVTQLPDRRITLTL
jgi:GNAT superfamily N-acetyltransferase